ncbi:MAG: DUF3592 domain-containing protein [Anaerolineaceae bacterium]
MSTSIVIIISSVCMLALGIYRLWKVIELSRRISAGKTWPVIMGDVVSKIVTVRHTRKSGTSFYPEVTYHYAIMGQDFEKQIRLAGIYSRNSAEKALAEIGETLEVHYNPDNPKETITPREKVSITDVIIVVVMLGLAIYLLSTYLL